MATIPLEALNNLIVGPISRLTGVPVAVINVVLVSAALLWISLTLMGLALRIIGAIVGILIREPSPRGNLALIYPNPNQGSILAGAVRPLAPEELQDEDPEISEQPQTLPAIPPSSKVNPTDGPAFWG